MPHYLDSLRAQTQPGAIEIPFDLTRTLHDQIVAAMPATPPRPCERHPDELRPVDLPAIVQDQLTYDDGYKTYELQSKFTELYDRCSTCPRNQASQDTEIEGCAAVCYPIFKNSMHRLDGSRKLLPHKYDYVKLQAGVSVQDQYKAWQATRPAFRCQLGKELLKLRETQVEPPYRKLTFWPMFAPCLRCGLERLGILPAEARASFDNFIIDPPAIGIHMEACRTFAADPKGFLLLLGNNGTGKTHLAIAVLRELLRRRMTGLHFIKHRQFVDQHRQSQRPVAFGKDAPASPLERCQQAALLVYDELTATTDTGLISEDLMLNLLETRISSYKPTIITSNLSPKELEIALGSRLYDRLRFATCGVFEFGFESKRGSFNSDYLSRCRPGGKP